MKIQENISLKTYNTFGIDKKARFFVEVSTEQEIIWAIQKSHEIQKPLFVLGGGSNILLTQDIDALVVYIQIKGIFVIKQDDGHIWVKVGAGVAWHDFVLHCIRSNWQGAENLSLIPGTVGASPMQNIGAYGVELKEIFDHLEAIEIKTQRKAVFDSKQCRFGYRESIFKHDAKDQFIISHVVFRLNKTPVFNTGYGAIKDTLAKMGNKEPDLKVISDAVVRIRQSKLPDPKEIGNAGSFFKNPTVSNSFFLQLREKYPDIPGYPMEENVKIPAAWLIEKAGWKGKTFENIGVHKNQALVLVNYGGGDGLRIKKLSEQIQKDIFEKFHILLQSEVNIL